MLSCGGMVLVAKGIKTSHSTDELHESSRKTLDASEGHVHHQPRIETQIHRRSKAKAIFPLEAEWQLGSDHPSALRLPANLMERQKKDVQ